MILTVILSVAGGVALTGLVIGLICVGVECMVGRKGTIFARIGRKG